MFGVYLGSGEEKYTRLEKRNNKKRKGLDWQGGPDGES